GSEFQTAGASSGNQLGFIGVACIVDSVAVDSADTRRNRIRSVPWRTTERKGNLVSRPGDWGKAGVCSCCGAAGMRGASGVECPACAAPAAREVRSAGHELRAQRSIRVGTLNTNNTVGGVDI